MSQSTETYDYVIIGAGSAGCTVAETLSRDSDRTVCVLEAGGSDDQTAIRTPMLMQQCIRSEQLNWGYVTQPQPALNNRELVWPRGKVVGGSSSINAMHYIRGAKENYDEWARAYGADGWSWDEVLPVFKRQQHQTRGASALHGDEGPLWVQDIAPLNPLTSMFLDAGGEMQFAANPDFNGEHQAGFGVYQVTQKGPRRWSAADAFLKPALDRPNLTLHTGALTQRVAFDGARAEGVHVEIDGEARLITARREVILCGGAINSPQLLQLSGVGDPSHLRSVGVEVVLDLPGVGENLQDHLDILTRIETRSSRSIGYSLRSAPRIARDVIQWMARGDGAMTVNPVQGGAFVHSKYANGLPDLQLVFIPSHSSPHGRDYILGHGATLHVCILYPKSRGSIRIASADPAQAPLIDPKYGSDEEDIEALADGLDISRRILDAPAFADERVREVEPGPEVSTRAQLLDDVRARAETLYHPTSTCAMGTGELAVCDARLRVRGAQNLRVVDASVMPRLVGGNTNAPTIMIAGKASEMIREDNA